MLPMVQSKYIFKVGVNHQGMVKNYCFKQILKKQMASILYITFELTEIYNK